MKLRERALPAIAALAVLAVAALVILLLNSATNDGVKALESTKLAQVQTTARGFDARVDASLASVAGLGARPWELVEGSEADQAVLDTFAIDPEARSGLFLLDADDVVTAGVLLEEGALGSTYAATGWDAAKAVVAAKGVAILPVTDEGLTSDLPTYGFAIGIPGATPGELRGTLIFEAALTDDSAFQLEIQALRDPSATTGVWRFVDDNGVVVATSAATGLGEEVTDLDLDALEPGLTRGETLVFSDDVPSVGWRVVYVQDRDEFVAPLAGPLRTAGIALVLLLLVVGLVLVGLLVRRLRLAREEERRLRELARSQEEFISVVSHELRTPVAGVLGFLQTTLDHWELMSEEERLTAVRRAFLNARRLQAMTRDVLDTESLESGRFCYTIMDLDLTC